MEAPSLTLLRKTRRSRWCLSITCTVAIAVLVAIIVPIAIVFSRRKHSNSTPYTVLVPLYIYPDLGAWDPLYDVVTAHSKLSFIVIINPEDGPGSSQHPNDDYTPQIQQLNTYSNVRTIGYVRTGYATKDLDSVLHEVDRYSGWASNETENLAMHGIFFDETPSEYSPTNADYMRHANQAARQASGLSSDQLIVHNPGTIPDARLNEPNTNFTVVFEGSYPDFQLQQGQLASLAQPPTQKSYLIHSVPQNINMRDFVGSLSQNAEWLYITNLEVDFYNSFGSSWKEFVKIMAR